MQRLNVLMISTGTRSPDPREAANNARLPLFSLYVKRDYKERIHALDDVEDGFISEEDVEFGMVYLSPWIWPLV